jgi:hypothetical protein
MIREERKEKKERKGRKGRRRDVGEGEDKRMSDYI